MFKLQTFIIVLTIRQVGTEHAYKVFVKQIGLTEC